MKRLRLGLAFARHLLRRIPVVVREGRAPRGPKAVLGRLRVAFRDYTAWAGGPRLDPARLPAPGPAAGARARLLFLTHNLNLEGAPIFELALARGLRARGYHVWVISPQDGRLRARYAAEDIPVVVGDALHRIRRERRYRKRITGLARWLRATGVDLVFCNTLRSFWGAAVAGLAPCPAVWAIHESVDWRAYFEYLPPPLRGEALACLRTADRLVFACDATRKLYADLEAPGRVHRIHYGIDLAAIDAFKRRRSRAGARASHGVGPDDRVVIVVGTTCERKGQLDFLRMAQIVGGAAGQRYRFYVVGARPGEYLSRLQRFVREERLGSVVLVDETPEVYDYYRMADVLVCSSYEESFPIVVLEAMAFELPIVSTDVFGIPEAVTDGRDAVLVPAGDVPALAAGVRRLLDDGALADKLARSARATCVSRFSLERMVDEYERLLLECLGR